MGRYIRSFRGYNLSWLYDYENNSVIFKYVYTDASYRLVRSFHNEQVANVHILHIYVYSLSKIKCVSFV